MATTHISLAEAGDELAGLVRRVLDGEDIAIDTERVTLRLERDTFVRRSVTESLARAEARFQERGWEPVIDAGFAEDLQDRVAHRSPRAVHA